MTWPLPETSHQTMAATACRVIQANLKKYQAVAIGPGLSREAQSRRFVFKMVATLDRPQVVDADALNALAGHCGVLRKNSAVKILTPHVGEMARLISESKRTIEGKRKEVAITFAAKYNCILVLKGHETIVAAPERQVYINKSGNPGMATAGSGDVLTGMIAAFLGQGLSGFEAAKWGVYSHGKAGDLAARKKTRVAMIASDIIDNIPDAIKAALRGGASFKKIASR